MKKISTTTFLHCKEVRKLLFVMKLTTLFLILGLMQVSASVYSQATKFEIKVENKRIADVLKEIEESSNFRFFYVREQVDVDRPVSAEFKEATVEVILNEIFSGEGVTYKVQDDDLIILSTEITKSHNTGLSTQQELSVSGEVTDASGELLPGVTVLVKGTSNGTVTSVDGTYSISNVSANDVLQFSFIGMISQEVTVGSQSVINIAMEDETIGLDEVIAIGYGVTKRKNFTGSVTTVDMNDSPILNKATTDAFSLLDGITTGVTFSKSGEAGSETQLEVRGQSSIQGGSSTPLLVVDGVIFSGSMNDIDPSTVENIQVLKDATSLAAYGSQAANGVIMITRKKGIKGKPMINVNASAAILTPNYHPEMRSPEGFIELMNDRNGTDDMSWISPLELANYNENTPTDWYDMITRTGVQQNYSLNVSGASDNMDYFIAGSYLDNKNFIEGDGYKRTTFNARINTQINEYLKIGANFDQSFSNNDGVAPNYSAAVTLSPWTEPYLSDGRWRLYVDGREQSVQNPLWNTYNGVVRENRRTSTVLGGNAELKIPGVEGLSYKVTGSYTKSSTLQRSFTDETNFVEMALGEDGYTPEGQAQFLIQANGTISENINKSWVVDNILTYTNEFDEHFVSATLVYTRDSRQTDAFGVTGRDFSAIGNTNLGFYGLRNAVTQEVSSISYQLHNDIGYLARVNYSYKDTYHFNASFRRDGSSVFGEDKKWGNFPAVGLAWTISNESFLSTSSVVDNLKLKASWGKNGNQTIGAYGTLSTMNMGRGGGIGYYFGNDLIYGQSLATLGNTELAWETTTSYNLGVEVDLWKRLHIELDGYGSKTTDQIFTRDIPVMGAGISQMPATMGEIQNWGIEAVVNSTNIQSGDFRWTSGLTFSLNRNKLAELYGDGQDDVNARLFIGESLGAIYGYEFVGVVQEDDAGYIAANSAHPGDAMYANLDNNEQITLDDRKILGFGKESFRMGLQNTLTYKNFQLYMLLNGIFSTGKYGFARNDMAYLTSDNFNYHNTLDHPYWTEENPSEIYPSIHYRDDRFQALQRITFVRLQEVNFSYSFGNELIDKFGVSNLKVFVSGTNLFFIAPDWEYSDPEVRSHDRAQLPRTFTLGINVTL